MNGRQIETTATARSSTMHLRRPGRGQTLCGIAVDNDFWKAWGREVFNKSSSKCKACSKAVAS